MKKLLMLITAILMIISISACGCASDFVEIGEVIQFGKYNWLVLDIKDGKALIIAENAVEPNIYEFMLTDVTWETSFLRGYLNDRFLQNFTAEEQSRIAETQIKNPDNLWYGTPGGADTNDKIFLLSIEEADKYFGDSGDYLNKKRKSWKDGEGFEEKENGRTLSNTHDDERAAILDYGPTWWWLRSPGANNLCAACVNIGGSIDVSGRDVDAMNHEMGGVRPVLWLIPE